MSERTPQLLEHGLCSTTLLSFLFPLSTSFARCLTTRQQVNMPPPRRKVAPRRPPPVAGAASHPTSFEKHNTDHASLEELMEATKQLKLDEPLYVLLLRALSVL